MSQKIARPPPGRGLSARLLSLAVAFVLLGEVLIYVPSIARFRLSFLEQRIAAAHLASLGAVAPPGERLDVDLEDALLRHAGVLAITLWRPDAEIMLGQIAAVDAVYDLQEATPASLVLDSFETLLARGERIVRVIGPSPQEVGSLVDIVLPEASLWVAMIDYSWRILALSIVLSAVVAVLLFWSLRRMILRPLERVAEGLLVFRERPTDVAADPPPTGRADEIGVVERELALMREQIRMALAQQMRLAALGAAVAKISHDLRNILASAVLLSERLERSADPEVRKVAPRIVAAIDRAVRLCTETLSFARSRPVEPRLAPVELAPLIDELVRSLVPEGAMARVETELPQGLTVIADRDQLYRALLNVVRNALDALDSSGAVAGHVQIAAVPVDGRVVVDVTDNGPGVPEPLRKHLFEAFRASGKADGSGLGLAISRELLHAQGGEIELLKTGPLGTTFRLTLPAGPAAVPAEQAETMTMRASGAGLLMGVAVLVGSCGWGMEGPPVAGYRGLQFEIISYYDRWALEENATCTQPRMQAITRADVLEETPERVVLDVRYRYLDEGQRDFDDDVIQFPRFRFGTGSCSDFSQRTFVIAKTTDGGGQVESMTGPQRRPQRG
ncbi:MAG TPA: HAMP domain-containing sensor histidine kinase [Geminicoccaceae bacterium]|nr:HAMP domain-containing sensor histidine kinase [Geminicoccaceae bacterium]